MAASYLVLSQHRYICWTLKRFSFYLWVNDSQLQVNYDREGNARRREAANQEETSRGEKEKADTREKVKGGNWRGWEGSAGSGPEKGPAANGSI